MYVVCYVLTHEKNYQRSFYFNILQCISIFKTLISCNYVPEGQKYFFKSFPQYQYFNIIFRTEIGTTMDDQNLKPIYLPASICSLVPFPKIILSVLVVTQSSMP